MGLDSFAGQHQKGAMGAYKIVIALSTYNRPLVTQICLRSLQAVRSPEVWLVAYDDASTAYDRDFLAASCDEVVRFHRNGGIERSRARALRDFVHRFQDYDLLYLTDNDTVHDPVFVSQLNQFFRVQAAAEKPFPVCLYNSRFHAQASNLLSETKSFLVRKTAPGVSHCYNRAMAETIVRGLDQRPDLETIYGWDYYLPSLLGVPFLQSRTSYLEHFARDRDEAGLHSKNTGTGPAAISDFDRDRALFPTPFLEQIRPEVIAEILGRGEVKPPS